jgi:3-hydroxybutyryl-CoA dehydratase
VIPQVGERASVEATFSAEDIRLFANLSGDTNALHLDDSEGRSLGFAGRIAHGMLTASLISRLLGTQLPGRGTIYLSQSIRFLRPVYPGEALRAEVEVTETRPEKRIVTLDTRVWARDELAIDGSAVVLLRDPGPTS